MVIPTIGFFMPLPLAMMIPFMGIQSAVMAKQFGENFQYGKRRISAMSNEEFNKLTPAILQERANEELKAMIPTMEASITDMRDFQKFIVKEFLEMISDLISQGLGSLFGPDIVGALEHFAHGHGGAPPGHQPDWKPGTLPPPPPPPQDTEHKFLSPAEIIKHQQHGHLGGPQPPKPPGPPKPKPPDPDTTCFKFQQDARKVWKLVLKFKSELAKARAYKGKFVPGQFRPFSAIIGDLERVQKDLANIVNKNPECFTVSSGMYWS